MRMVDRVWGIVGFSMFDEENVYADPEGAADYCKRLNEELRVRWEIPEGAVVEFFRIIEIRVKPRMLEADYGVLMIKATGQGKTQGVV